MERKSVGKSGQAYLNGLHLQYRQAGSGRGRTGNLCQYNIKIRKKIDGELDDIINNKNI